MSVMSYIIPNILKIAWVKMFVGFFVVGFLYLAFKI